jgi:hypothetical protein
MEKLARGLQDYTKSDVADTADGLHPANNELQKAAEDWAVFCLRNHTDELLDKGLAVSKAISNYLGELELRVTNKE